MKLKPNNLTTQQHNSITTKNMDTIRKNASVLLAALIGSVSGIGIYKNYFDNNVNSTHYISAKLPVQKANYAFSAPASAIDFTAAAENTVHGEVHVKTSYESKVGN